ncbi:MAG: ABC transporter substrate-binding protein [Clostridiales bacterium]|nr:MAG: ABC transporter substrate-binding protein [Clostridiales bacterium]
MKKRMIALLVIVVLLVSACSANTEKKEEAKPAEETQTEVKNQDDKDSNHVKNLVIGTIGKNDIFNIVSAGGIFGSMNYNGFTQGNFVYRDENGILQPFFFRSFEISDDGKELTFTFPTDAIWHDGKPVTGDDIVFTFDYMKNVKKQGSLKELESCTIEGEGKGKLVFSEPMAYYWLNSSSFNSRVYPKHVWENITDYREYTGEDAAIGCGPYKLVKVDKESQTSYYEAVPENNYAGDVTVDKVTCQTYSDKSALLMALVQGEVDAMYNYANPIDAHLIETAIGVPDVDLGESDYSGNFQMTYGMERKPFDDINFRKAVRMSLDYKKIAEVINGSYGTAPGAGIIPPSCKGYDSSLPILSKNLEEANKILDEAGYLDQDGDGFRDYPDGSELDVMVTQQFSSSRQELFNRLSESIMASLTELNIKSHIDQDSLRSDEVWEKNITDGKYDLSLGYTTSGMAYYSSAFRYFLADPRFEGEETWIWGTFHNDEYRDAYFGMVLAKNDDEYIKNSMKLQNMANEYCYAQALCWEKAFFPYRTDKYEGWQNYPSWGVINPRTFFVLTEK